MVKFQLKNFISQKNEDAGLLITLGSIPSEAAFLHSKWTKTSTPSDR